MRLIDADAFDRALCNHEFTAALNEAADAGTAFEDKKMYYSTQSFRDVMKHRPTIDAVPLDKLCEWLAKYGYPCAIIDTEQCTLQECDVGISYSQEASRNCWKTILTNWMEEQNA